MGYVIVRKLALSAAQKAAAALGMEEMRHRAALEAAEYVQAYLVGERVMSEEEPPLASSEREARDLAKAAAKARAHDFAGDTGICKRCGLTAPEVLRRRIGCDEAFAERPAPRDDGPLHRAIGRR